MLKKIWWYTALLLAAGLNWATTTVAQPYGTVKTAWVTNVGSEVLTSRAKIKEAVKLAKKAGLTHLCVVTWNNGYTLYKSPTMQAYFGVAIDPVYGNRDPLQEMIAEAHKANLKVIAWFEFGFSSSYGGGGTHILQKYPHWAARDREGKVLVENGFTWMNSFLPEVQTFVTKLVLEVVRNYNVDGIQGDDRLPAAPVRGGYDDYTQTLYRQQHAGANPPHNYNQPNWVNWRAQLMNAYGKDLYRQVKQLKPNVLVAHAPSIYPWSKEHYLQDWPAWLKDGYTDMVMPQVYRYNYEAYTKTLDEMVAQVGPQQLNRVFPGMLTSLADGYLIREGLLDSCIRYNRSKGINGEAFFYFEGIRRSKPYYLKKYPKYTPGR
ncbi:MAG: family 10 glycosylhydrolase [Chitinophagaceae bacterium]|nr:family 10 glycosylhydrolase [Chitinophagaceae bacterium]